jgi:hypothetical protein
MRLDGPNDSESEDEDAMEGSGSDVHGDDSEDDDVLDQVASSRTSSRLWTVPEDHRLATAVGAIRPVEVGPHDKNKARAASWKAVAELVGNGRSGSGCSLRWKNVCADRACLEIAISRAVAGSGGGAGEGGPGSVARNMQGGGV